MNGLPEMYEEAPRLTDAEWDARHAEADAKADELSVSDQDLKASMERQMEAALELAEIFRKALADLTPSQIAFIEQYAAAKAKYIIARDNMERCGFLRRGA